MLQADWRSRRNRVRQILEDLNIDKETFCERLNASESQYYRWVRSDVDSRYSAAPSIDFMAKFCTEFGVSPTYILLGIGRKWISEIQTIEQAVEALTFNKQFVEDIAIPFISEVKKQMADIKRSVTIT